MNLLEDSNNISTSEQGARFEASTAKLFENLHLIQNEYRFENVLVTKRTGDGGIDILMDAVNQVTGEVMKCCVQCKDTERVGRPEIQSFHSALSTYKPNGKKWNGKKWGCVVTSGRFTLEAENHAKEVNSDHDNIKIDLIDGDEFRAYLSLLNSHGCKPIKAYEYQMIYNENDFVNSFERQVANALINVTFEVSTTQHLYLLNSRNKYTIGKCTKVFPTHNLEAEESTNFIMDFNGMTKCKVACIEGDVTIDKINKFCEDFYGHPTDDYKEIGLIVTDGNIENNVNGLINQLHKKDEKIVIGLLSNLKELLKDKKKGKEVRLVIFMDEDFGWEGNCIPIT